jgi:Leucine Rich repeat
MAKVFVALLQLKSTKLEKIDLQLNYLGDDFITIFACGLKYNTHLKELNLSGNIFTYYFGAAAVANVLYYNQSLLDLDLSFNNMEQDALNEITASLRYHPSLQRLVVGDNGTEGAIIKLA